MASKGGGKRPSLQREGCRLIKGSPTQENCTTKRVLLQITTGPHAGLTRIMGVVDAERADAGCPLTLADIDLGTHRGTCALVQVTKRYLVYREVEPVTQ